MKNRFIATESNNADIEFAFYDRKYEVYTQLSKDEFECLKTILQHTTDDVGEAHTPDDAEKVGIAILERGRVMLAEEIKCQCGNDGCKMQASVNGGTEGIIWLEIENIGVNPARLIKQMTDNDINGWTTTRAPFALDMNGAVGLIHMLQAAINDEITRMNT